MIDKHYLITESQLEELMKPSNYKWNGDFPRDNRLMNYGFNEALDEIKKFEVKAEGEK